MAQASARLKVLGPCIWQKMNDEPACPQADVVVSVLTLSGRLVATLCLPVASTVRILKVRLARSCSSPPFAQQLLWSDRALLDHETLISLHLPALPTFQLLCCPCLGQASGELLESARL